MYFKHKAIHNQSLSDRIINGFPFRNFFISLPPGIILSLQIPVNVEGTIEPTPWYLTPFTNRLYWYWIRPFWDFGIYRVEKPHFLKLGERSARVYDFLTLWVEIQELQPKLTLIDALLYSVNKSIRASVYTALICSWLGLFRSKQ